MINIKKEDIELIDLNFNNTEKRIIFECIKYAENDNKYNRTLNNILYLLRPSNDYDEAIRQQLIKKYYDNLELLHKYNNVKTEDIYYKK